MTSEHIFLILTGFVIGYSVFSIIDIIKTNKLHDSLHHSIKQVRENLPKGNDKSLAAYYVKAIKKFGMPKEKIAIFRDDKALAVTYGHSHVVVIDKTRLGLMISIAGDKRSKQTDKEKLIELQELKQVLTSTEKKAEDNNFSSILTDLLRELALIEQEKYSDVTRHITSDML